MLRFARFILLQDQRLVGTRRKQLRIVTNDLAIRPSCNASNGPPLRSCWSSNRVNSALVAASLSNRPGVSSQLT